MWTENSMSFLESMTVSGLGLAVVFVTLLALAIALTAFSKVFVKAGKKAAAGAAPSAVFPTTRGNEDDEAFAALVAAISEEMNVPIDSFQIKEVREISVSD